MADGYRELNLAIAASPELARATAAHADDPEWPIVRLAHDGTMMDTVAMCPLAHDVLILEMPNGPLYTGQAFPDAPIIAFSAQAYKPRRRPTLLTRLTPARATRHWYPCCGI